jgi:hypothetical protein|tara:strand:- start:401 stop:526 length:126 start_codon:yes stop_codon:yes gene_type:complete
MKVESIVNTLQKAYNDTQDVELKLEIKYMIEDLMMYREVIV